MFAVTVQNRDTSWNVEFKIVLWLVLEVIVINIQHDIRSTFKRNIKDDDFDGKILQWLAGEECQRLK